jgi:hypothetical protein
MNTEQLQSARLGMVQLCFSGQISGMTCSLSKNSQDYSYAKNKNISLAMFILNNRIEDQFHLPLSVQAFQEYQQLQQILQNIQVNNSSRDCCPPPKFVHMTQNAQTKLESSRGCS